MEREFVASVARALQSHGQAVMQFITATLDSRVLGSPDLVFAPDDPEKRVVCVEFKRSEAPTLSPITLADVLRHRKTVEEANEGVVFVLATNARLEGKTKEIAETEGLVVLRFDWTAPAKLASAIILVASGTTPTE